MRHLIFYNTLTPYDVIQKRGIEYSVCKDYDHISRYRGLRQVIHCPTDSDRITTLETPNPFITNTEVYYYEVPNKYENRIDLIARDELGSCEYAWVISYFNRIEDGFTVNAGQRLVIPKSFYDLFNTGEVLQSIPATQLNLGQE